jgi:hypothetical protein
MTMKYNRALDLLCGAAQLLKSGKPNSAAKALAAAIKDPSFTAGLKLINANNEAAYNRSVKAARVEAKRRKMRAGVDDGPGLPDFEPGEELRVDVEENGDRIIQEADFDEMMGDDDFDDMEVLSAAKGEEDDEEEDEDEDDEDEKEDKKASSNLAARLKSKVSASATKPPIKISSAAQLARALKNLEALK